MPDANAYSRLWFDTFLGRIDDTVVGREVAFLARQLAPLGTVLDLCCGPGRHAAPLASRGHRVVGVDLDAAALAQARVRAPNAGLVRGDMRRIPLATGSVDAVLCMWQSFGHFDEDRNAATLGEMARVLRRGGCLVLDLYHREFHEAHLGERLIERDGARVRERRWMRGNRLHVELRYEPSGATDLFDWRLYTPLELAAAGESVGLRMVLACAEFDEAVAASAARARMQIILAKRA